MSTIQERITNSFNSQGLMKTLGACIALVEHGEVHIEMPFSPNLSQHNGYAHAGSITSIVDSACGYAALTTMPEDSGVVSAEFKINFMRPAIGDRFLAIGKVQSAGKTLVVTAGEVRAYTGNDYKVVALMQATMVNVRP